MSRILNAISGEGGALVQAQSFLTPSALNNKTGSTDAWIHIRPALRDPMQQPSSTASSQTASKKVHDSGVTMSSAASSTTKRSKSNTKATPEPVITEEWELVYPDE